MFLRVLASCLLLPLVALAADPEPVADGRARYLPLLTAEAVRQGIPPALADAVATVESNYDAQALGGSGEIGLMQVMPPTAAMLGFRGTPAELAVPETNVRLGIRYLAGAWSATGGRLCDTLMKYRAGYGETVMSLRSVIYCHRARDYLASIGSPLAAGPGTELPPITPAMLAADAAAPRAIIGRMPVLMTRAEIQRMHAGHRTPADSQRFWLAEEAYIRALRQRASVRRLAGGAAQTFP